MANKYIFKLTPNNKNVIINSDVLINGYENVLYPVSILDSSKLNYVLDPDTFKFNDSSVYVDEKKPYPIKMEMTTSFKDLPFYGVNKAYSTDKIIFKCPVLISNDENKLTPSADGTYDECIYGIKTSGYSGKDGYYTDYKIYLKIYWSDNKSHATEIGDIINDNISSVVIRLIPDNNYKKQLLSDGNTIYTISDNHTSVYRDAVLFLIEATFTDPITHRSVTASLLETVKLQAYPGTLTGYAHVKFVDTTPLEIWSPTITPIYAKSKDDEANIKIDSKLYTEYYGFNVSGSLNRTIDSYTAPDLYYKGATTISPLVDSSLKDSSITTLFKLTNIVFDNFCLNSLENCNFNNLDETVFSNDDVVNFLNRFNNCKTCTNTSLFNLAENYEAEELYINTSLSLPTARTIDSSIVIDNIEGFYRAAYANYIIEGNKYYQCSNLNENKYYPVDYDADIDISINDILYDSSTKKTVAYKVTNDSKGNSILTKYCVNSLLDPSYVQVPRYGIYPELESYIPVDISVYDFTGKIITVKDYTNSSNITMYKQNNYISFTITNWNSTRTEGEKIIDETDESDSSTNTDTVKSLINNDTQNNIYGVENDNSIKQEIAYSSASLKIYTAKITGDSLCTKFRLNGNNIEVNKTEIINDVNPNIFVLSLDEFDSEYNNSVYTFDLTDNNTKETVLTADILLTNDENEKHLTTYDNNGKVINTKYHSSMLLRANPKLSGNIKLVVDTNYNLYLDTFKANNILNDKKYRKYPISDKGNYPHDVYTVFKNIPSNKLYTAPENSLNPHKAYHEFKDQYETMYEYGAETNTDSLYEDNMKILAPLHIGDNIPDFFVIFRYNDLFNEETYNGSITNDKDKFKKLLLDSVVVSSYDLRTHTSIGQYLNNYKDMLSNYGQCYLQFIEQDYNQNSPSYRQGNNIWKGISIKRGLLVDLSETTYFGSKILNSDASNRQELFNNYIINGFERHNILYPNIINLEYMFNDNIEEYSMNRYFGLYLSSNDFINYSYILKDNEIFKKYDINGNLYKGDLSLLNTVFNNKYSDRLFFAITNKSVLRIHNNTDLNKFFTNNVINTPDKNLIDIDADLFEFKTNEKCFITLHFSKPLKYGEHLKFIAFNYKTKDDNNEEQLNNIVYEIIASNDIRLKDADYYINPYISNQLCRYSENTYFYRLTFYSQDLDYKDITATIEEQIERIVHCINKFDSFIKVSDYTSTSISIISEVDNMYLQHIDAPDLSDFKYDYCTLENGINTKLYTTNDKYTDSIDFIPHNGIEDKIPPYLYTLTNDIEHDWLINGKPGDWISYVETSDPANIKHDSISYYNKYKKYNMYALSNQSDYFENDYVAFSNYGFETLGWRYNNIIKFLSVNDDFNYVLYKDVQYLINDVKYPLVYNVYDNYETLNMFNISYGYLRNNIVDPDIDRYKNWMDKQHIIYNSHELFIISSPYNSEYCLINTKSDSLLTNNRIHLYNPLSVSISVMGISNVNDIDTTIDCLRIIHRESCLTVNVNSNEIIVANENDYRLQNGVMYEVVEGVILAEDKSLKNGNKFIFTNNKLYSDICPDGISCTFIKMKTNVIYKVIDKPDYQIYNYDTNIPELKSSNYYSDINNIKDITNNLVYPIVPSIHCNWQSSGQYFDSNNILDVNTLNSSYVHQGNFAENIYTPGNYESNQYIMNKIDSILYVNNLSTTFKDCILNKNINNAIYKLLIDTANINTASVYYNSNIKSIEFIFSGIKFEIKLNSKVVNTYLHLEDYTGFNAFVINDYDIAKNNELYVSITDKFLLLINHNFYIDNKYSAVNNIKDINNGSFKGYVDYAAFKAPYSIDMSVATKINDSLVTYKKNDIHTSLMSVIDKHNLWNSLFVQYDIPYIDSENNEVLFIQSLFESINEYDNFITFDTCKYGIKVNENIKSTYSDSYSFVITRAAVNNNELIKNLLNDINNKITVSDNPIITKTNKLSDKHKIDITNFETDFNIKLSNLIDTDLYNVFDNGKIYSFNRYNFGDLLKYIECLIVKETDELKLLRYVKSFTNNIDIYVIPETGNIKYINNSDSYNPLIFKLSIPNLIKFNHGWFTPAYNKMFEFELNDELSDKLNIDLMLSNTKFNDIHRILNYTGNKVVNDNNLNTLYKNYFMIDEKSLLSSTWDCDYYRLYKNENDYTSFEGHKTGIDDKSFFGSRCMVVKHEYILLDTWRYKTANDLYSISIVNAKHNISSNNNKNTKIVIYLSSVFSNYFMNNNAFIENWNYFKDLLHTGMINYINNTILSYYNLNSDLDITLYAIDTVTDSTINIVEQTPDNINEYYVYENYSTSIETKNNQVILTILLNDTSGKNIFPNIKIYKR